MKLVYIANARMPTEKAHGYQVCKMCEAFASVKLTTQGSAQTPPPSPPPLGRGDFYAPSISPPLWGGEIKRGGVIQDLNVELIIPRRFNKIKESPFDYYGIKRNFKITKLPCLDLIPLSKYLGPVGFWIEVLTFNFSLFLELLFQKGDIVYSRDWSVLPLSWHGKNFIFEAHKFPKNYFLYSFFLKRLKAIIVLTEKLKDCFVAKGIPAEKVLVAPDAVDLNTFALDLSKEKARENLGLPQDKKIIGYFGRFQTMEMEKGLKDVLRVLVLLEKEVVFVAVGGSKEEIAFYEAKADKLGVRERVIFIERVSRPMVAQYQKACDCLLMPFPDLPHYAFYMSPVKMFEYMASRRSIVATGLVSIREVLNEKSAILVEPGNLESLVAGIRKAIFQPDLVKALVEQAYQDVQNYTWQKRVQKIIDFLAL